MWCYQCKELKQVYEQTPFRHIVVSIQEKKNTQLGCILLFCVLDKRIISYWLYDTFWFLETSNSEHLTFWDPGNKVIIWIIANTTLSKWVNWGWGLINDFLKIARRTEVAFRWSGTGYFFKAWALNHCTLVPHLLFPQPLTSWWSMNMLFPFQPLSVWAFAHHCSIWQPL